MMVQAPAASAAFVHEMLVAPAAAVSVPPQVLLAFGDEATFRLAGRLAVKLPSMAEPWVLLIENVRLDGLFTATVDGLKPRVIVGAPVMVMLVVAVTLSNVELTGTTAAEPPAWKVD